MWYLTHDMGWLRLVGSLKLYVSFAKEPYKRDYILQKRPIFLRSLLVVGTPYYNMWHITYKYIYIYTHTSVCVCVLYSLIMTYMSMWARICHAYIYICACERGRVCMNRYMTRNKHTYMCVCMDLCIHQSQAVMQKFADIYVRTKHTHTCVCMCMIYIHI